MIGTLLIAVIAVGAIVSSLLAMRDQRRTDWLERRIWTARARGAPHGRSAYPPSPRS